MLGDTESDGARQGRSALEALAAETGVSWTLRERMAGGFQGGAWLTESTSGTIAVLKLSAASWTPRVVAAAPIVRALCEQG